MRSGLGLLDSPPLRPSLVWVALTCLRDNDIGEGARPGRPVRSCYTLLQRPVLLVAVTVMPMVLLMLALLLTLSVCFVVSVVIVLLTVLVLLVVVIATILLALVFRLSLILGCRLIVVVVVIVFFLLMAILAKFCPLVPLPVPPPVLSLVLLPAIPVGLPLPLPPLLSLVLLPAIPVGLLPLTA